MTKTLRAVERAAFEAWLKVYYIAEQHPLTIEALWDAWQEGARHAAAQRRRKVK